MSFRLSPILQGHESRISGMACPREVIRNRDNKVVAYVDSQSGPPVVSNSLTKSDVKALGPLRRPD